MKTDTETRNIYKSLTTKLILIAFIVGNATFNKSYSLDGITLFLFIAASLSVAVYLIFDAYSRIDTTGDIMPKKEVVVVDTTSMIDPILNEEKELEARIRKLEAMERVKALKEKLAKLETVAV